MKHFRDYTRSFTVDPGAAGKLERLTKAVMEIGQLVTFKEACMEEPVEEPFFVEDRFAWHKTWADAWAGTPEARAWDPILAEMRRDYAKHVQPITEAPANVARFRPLVEKYWYHLTNSANSDGRWPAPPAETCPFNREWVLKEMDRTRAALAELKAAIAGMALPAPAEDKDADQDWVYGYHFTNKDVTVVAKLNNYELQHAIYFAHKMVDSKNAEKSTEGKALLRKVFDELDRRGMKGVRPPSIQGK